MKSDSQREALQAEIATLYYVDGFKQEDIARHIGRSVATVSRLLAQAHANQFVDVHVRYPVPMAPALQAELVKRFGLRVARVARTASNDPQHLAPQVIDLAARYVSTILTDDAIICLAWGTAVRGVVHTITPGQHRGLHVVQGLGSLGSRLPTIDNPLLIQILADRVGGTPHYLPAPTIVASAAVRDALARDPHFSETLGLFRRADIALIGVGPTDPERSGLCRAGYLDAWDMERIRATGAVGDIMVEFYDINGTLMETDITSRVMGMRRDDLRSARSVVAVAGGIAKAPAILGALRTGLIHVLVTDDVTARKVLELASAHPGPDHAPGVSADRAGSSTAPDSSLDDAGHAGILDATLRVLARDGYHRLTVDAVATAATVGREAVVRGWKTKSDLVRDAFTTVGSWALHESGSLQTELTSLLVSQFAATPGHDSIVPRAHLVMLRESRHEPALQRLYQSLQAVWRDELREAISRAQSQGALDSPMPPETLADLLLGPIWFRLYGDHDPVDTAFLEDVVATALARASAVQPTR